MKGIVLAGGSGTRLYPITKAISKQLMPIYDKPMIYYPLSILMMAGIKDVLIITTPEDNPQFKRLLGDGSQVGCNFQYAIQEVPNGLAQAQSLREVEGGYVFAYQVSDPERYGVVEFDAAMNAVSIEEKPIQPKSNYAVPGLYFYDNEVVKIAKELKPSARGEYEITDVNKTYLLQGKLKVAVLDKGTAWLDTGTFDSLSDASEYVRVIEKRQGTNIGCIEEIAYRNGFISKEQLLQLADDLKKSGYGEYLRRVVEEG